MADITVTPGNVLPGSGAIFDKEHVFAETVTQGMACYFKAADSKWYMAKNDTSIHAGSGGIGIAMNAGSAGQPATIQTGGKVTIGATVAVGTIYTVSATFGGICPYADITSSKYVTILGPADTTGSIDLTKAYASGIAKA